MRVQPIHVIDRNKKFPGRKPNLWLRYPHPVHGRKVPVVEEKAKPGVKAMASQMADLRRAMKEGTWTPPEERKEGMPLFAAYAMAVHRQRTADGIGASEPVPNQTEHGYIVNHLIPAFGKYTLAQLTSFRVILDGFKGRKEDDPATRATRINHKGLGGRTVGNIHSTFRAIMYQAVEDEIVDMMPPPLTVARDHIPPRRDVDPEWRKHAKFARREVVSFAMCEDVSWLYRALLVTYFYTGPRFNELHRQRVEDYDRDMQPLRCLTVKASKLGRHAEPNQVRHVPVHPELQAWLDWWLDEAWPFLYGRQPRPDDYLFPPLSKRLINRGIGFITYQSFVREFRDKVLPAVGLQNTRPKPDGAARHRGQGIHCARHTFISLMRSARVDDKLLRAMTHQGTGQRVLDMYTHWEWDALCAELSKLTIGLPPPPYQSRPPIRLVTRGRDLDAGSETAGFKTSVTTANATPTRRG